MNNGSEASNKLKVVFGEIKYNEKDKSIEMPPKNAHEKYIDEIKENIVEIVLHQNTREILRKLEASKEEHTI